MPGSHLNDGLETAAIEPREELRTEIRAALLSNKQVVADAYDDLVKRLRKDGLL